MAGPLNGIRVVDLSRVLAGPWATQLLADYGADVIKLERPGAGDDTRHWGPPWAWRSGESHGDAAYFLAANRNKRSVTVDISSAAGQRIVRALAARADVFVENFRVGRLKRYGLDAASLREEFPRLVYCSISAYGQDSSRAGEPGYDAMVQAAGGLMSITGPPDDEGGGPQKTGVAIADIMAGMYAVTAILAALRARDRSGQGQHIDVPLYDCQVGWLANQAMNYLVTGEVPRRLGTAHPNIVPYQAFATQDGFLMLAVGNDRQFQDCADCLGLPGLAQDRRFASNAARVENRGELVRLLQETFRDKGSGEWLELLGARGIPCGPINDLAQVFTGPYAEERRFARSMSHAVAGRVPTVANPVRFSDTPVEYSTAPPVLGQDTAAVLREELGYSEREIAALRRDGAV